MSLPNITLQVKDPQERRDLNISLSPDVTADTLVAAFRAVMNFLEFHPETVEKYMPINTDKPHDCN